MFFFFTKVSFWCGVLLLKMVSAAFKPQPYACEKAKVWLTESRIGFPHELSSGLHPPLLNDQPNISEVFLNVLKNP